MKLNLLMGAYLAAAWACQWTTASASSNHNNNDVVSSKSALFVNKQQPINKRMLLQNGVSSESNCDRIVNKKRGNGNLLVKEKNMAATTAQQQHRGGAAVVNVSVDKNLVRSLLGAAVMAGIEYAMKHTLKAADIKFPAMLAGCLFLFGSLLVLDVVQPKLATGIADFLTPGAGLLAKWLPMFFVPGLALLPMAPSVGGATEWVKVLAVVILGLIHTIITVGATVVAFRGGSLNLLGTKSTRAVPVGVKKQPSKAQVAFSKPFTLDQVRLFGTLTAAAGVLLFLTSQKSMASQNGLAKMSETAFLTFFTVTSYMWAARLPSSFVQVVHPLVTSCVLVLVVVQGMSALTNKSFKDILRGYKVGSLDLKKAGSGDILLYLLGPCAVSFAISMFGKRVLLKKNLLVVVSAVVVSSIGGLFCTAAFVRAISLGGSSLLTNKAVRLSVLSRNVTTALALALTSMIGGDLAIAAAVCCLTGVIGATYGKAILEHLGVKDPITRGLCIGSSAQGLGVASMANEPDAFPFAAMAMVFTALTSTTLVTFPAFKQALVKLATGSNI